jgi:hypothetical protein
MGLFQAYQCQGNAQDYVQNDLSVRETVSAISTETNSIELGYLNDGRLRLSFDNWDRRVLMRPDIENDGFWQDIEWTGDWSVDQKQAVASTFLGALFNTSGELEPMLVPWRGYDKTVASWDETQLLEHLRRFQTLDLETVIAWGEGKDSELIRDYVLDELGIDIEYSAAEFDSIVWLFANQRFMCSPMYAHRLRELHAKILNVRKPQRLVYNFNGIFELDYIFQGKVQRILSYEFLREVTYMNELGPTLQWDLRIKVPYQSKGLNSKGTAARNDFTPSVEMEWQWNTIRDNFIHYWLCAVYGEDKVKYSHNPEFEEYSMEDPSDLDELAKDFKNGE